MAEANAPVSLPKGMGKVMIICSGEHVWRTDDYGETWDCLRGWPDEPINVKCEFIFGPPVEIDWWKL